LKEGALVLAERAEVDLRLGDDFGDLDLVGIDILNK
jgi:hypothetical protein